MSIKNIKKIQYGLLTAVVALTITVEHAQADESNLFGDQSNAAQICATPLQWFEYPESNRVKLAYTQKMKNNHFDTVMQVANHIVTAESKHLSPQAIQAINMTRVTIFHCDPKLQHKQTQTHDTAQFDYYSNLLNKRQCMAYENNIQNRNLNNNAPGGAAKNQKARIRLNGGVPAGAVFRNNMGQLQCRTRTPDGLCGKTFYCDANLLPASIAHFDPFPDDNNLVHEFGHTVMDVGLANGTPEERQRYKMIKSVYQNYFKRPNLCHGDQNTSYACHNEFEMWAMATQTWFHATCRDQTRIGMTSPQEIQKNLPRLYKILAATYGAENEVEKFKPFGDPNCTRKGRQQSANSGNDG